MNFFHKKTILHNMNSSPLLNYQGRIKDQKFNFALAAPNPKKLKSLNPLPQFFILVSFSIGGGSQFLVELGALSSSSSLSSLLCKSVLDVTQMCGIHPNVYQSNLLSIKRISIKYRSNMYCLSLSNSTKT